MKKLLLISVLLYGFVANSQVDTSKLYEPIHVIGSHTPYHVDTLFKMDIYTSYYSFKMKNPLMVVYNLHKGGGDCSRKDFHFKRDTILGKRLAIPQDYASSGYDEGHLANAEDFAYNCIFDKETFHFWNCCPQTPQLNRGIWKTMEDNVRNISLTDSLLILCGSIYGTKTIGGGVYVPEQCWKIVYSHTKHTVLLSNIFTNTNEPKVNSIDYHILSQILKTEYNIDIPSFFK